MFKPIMADNNNRRKHQKRLDIRVIVGNPPYSVGQESANDNNQNSIYPQLENRIRDTYAEQSTSNNKNSLYNSYILGIRWATDRIGESGIVGFVTSGGYLDASSADGLRKCLSEEFAKLYIFNLRGDASKSGEQRRKEKDNVFDSGSRSPIAIALLVKNPKVTKHGQIFYHDIGDYLTREEKLEKISQFVSVAGITARQGWQPITPDEHSDWLKQRDIRFSEFLAIGDKSGKLEKVLFSNYSSGVKTQRDAWCFNASREKLEKNMGNMIWFYNQEVKHFKTEYPTADRKEREMLADGFMNTSPDLISWTRALKQDFIRDKIYKYESDCLISSVYRPFTKQWLYFNRRFNEMVYQMPRIFPDAKAKNRMIVVKQRWGGDGYFALMVDRVMELQTDGGTQCFPQYLYEPEDATGEDAEGRPDGRKQQISLFSEDSGDLFEVEAVSPTAPQYKRCDAITDAGLAHFCDVYPGHDISKEDLFYYVYGLLHSPDYRERYADNLSKELPRIPCVKTAADFWVFTQAGRQLAHWHLNYETVEPYPATITGETSPMFPVLYRVEKMRYGKQGKDKDLSTIHYNALITVSGIPLEAYDYVVNGKSAIDWVMERQCVKTDKDSGIVNDANDWAVETMENPRYPLELLLRVITVSLETQKIVAALPKLDI